MSLDGVEQKIARAEHHLTKLQAQPLFKMGPGTGAVKVRQDGAWGVVTVAPPLTQLPVEPSLMCGDYIQNLRAALDHLVWQLVLANGKEPDNRNAFPIYTDEQRFIDRVTNRHTNDDGPLRGLDPIAQPWALILGEQPYERAKAGRGDARADRLAILAELSNIDKHRILLIQQFFVAKEAIWDAVGWDDDAQLIEYDYAPRPLSLEDETEVIRLRFASPEPHVRVKAPLGIDPTFGDEMGQVPFYVVRRLIEKVRVVVAQFANFV